MAEKTIALGIEAKQDPENENVECDCSLYRFKGP